MQVLSSFVSDRSESSDYSRRDSKLKVLSTLFSWFAQSAAAKIDPSLLLSSHRFASLFFELDFLTCEILLLSSFPSDPPLFLFSHA
jgi:hypothetical protein